MREYVTLQNIYAAWDFEKEIDELNMHSKNGLQLVKGGMFFSKYKKDNNIVYRYQIDFNLNIDNKPEYINVFNDQGWEYINSTFNGWHYFRKKYDASLPEHEYEIYTDRPSKVEMTKRWCKFAIPCLIFFVAFFVVNIIKLVLTPELCRIGLVVYFFTPLLLFITGLLKMNKVGKGNNFKRKSHLGTMLLVVVLAYSWFLLFSSLKATTNLNLSTTAYESISDMPNTINVKFPDLYYLSMHSKSEVAVTFMIESEDFNAVYTISGQNLNVENQRILLRRGVYTIYTIFDNDSLSKEEKSVKINYCLE